MENTIDVFKKLIVIQNINKQFSSFIDIFIKYLMFSDVMGSSSNLFVSVLFAQF